MGKSHFTDKRVIGADDEPEGYDASDPAKVGERKVDAKNAERERIAGLGQLLGTRQGRLWAWEMLAKCGVFRTSFTGNSTTFFNEGKRDIGLSVMADITREFPDAYLTMTKENANG